MKSYTDINQSKKLAKILPLESADAFYIIGKDPVDIVVIYGFVTHKHLKEQIAFKRAVPCWSLAALLKLIPNFNMFKRTIECKIETTNHSIYKTCDLVDAAFEMICWLKENNEL